MPFDYDLDFDNLDFRKQPELYRVGRGEQGVLLVEPYKGEILPHWRFKTPDIAEESSEKNNGVVRGVSKTRRFCRNGYGSEVYPNGLYTCTPIHQL